MNIAGRKVEESILCVSFDHNSPSLAIGRHNGFKLLSHKSINDLETIYDSADGPDRWWERLTHKYAENIHIVEMVFDKRIVATVSRDSPNKLLVTNLIQRRELLNLTYERPILSIKLNETTLVVCLEDKLHIFRLGATGCKHVHSISTERIPVHLFALSNNADNYLAYPSEIMGGSLEIFDMCNLQPVITISAHESALAALAFNSTGTMIATASEKGTIIRVFNIQNGSKIVDFLRGTTRFVDIQSLAFSADSRFLAVSSNTETIHVFKLESSLGFFDHFGRKLDEYGLLKQVSKYFSLKRAFVTVHLPAEGLTNICRITAIDNVLHILVYSDGDLYVYNLNLFEGGESLLLHKHSFSMDKKVM